MSISAELVKALREKTGVGFMECKRALEEANGDLESAVTILRKKGFSAGAKKPDARPRKGLIAHMCTTGKSA